MQLCFAMILRRSVRLNAEFGRSSKGFFSGAAQLSMADQVCAQIVAMLLRHVFMGSSVAYLLRSNGERSQVDMRDSE